jgi:hypothetical protein
VLLVLPDNRAKDAERALETVEDKKEEGIRDLSAHACPLPALSDEMGGRGDYLHVTNNVRVYELTIVFSLQLLAADLALASMA